MTLVSPGYTQAWAGRFPHPCPREAHLPPLPASGGTDPWPCSPSSVLTASSVGSARRLPLTLCLRPVRTREDAGPLGTQGHPRLWGLDLILSAESLSCVRQPMRSCGD